MRKKQKYIVGAALSVGGTSVTAMMITATSGIADPNAVMPIIVGLAAAAVGSALCAAGALLLPILCPQLDDESRLENQPISPPITTHPLPTPTPAADHKSDLSASSSASKNPTPSPFPSLLIRTLSREKSELTQPTSPKSPLSSRAESVPLKSLSPAYRNKSGKNSA